MATNYTSRKFVYNVARSFVEGVQSGSGIPNYIFLGNSFPYEDEQNPPEIFDSQQTEREIWLNMFAAKKITGNDVELVLPRLEWTVGQTYKQYDDIVELESLLNESDNVKPMYIMTTDRNVYKCISNNFGSISVVEPIGDYSTANGYVQTSDGYLWKYMYNVKVYDKYLTQDWMPVPYTYLSQKYDLNELNLIDGILANIEVVNPGSNYQTLQKNSAPFIINTKNIVLTSSDNVAVGMEVSGVGILPGTYITNINPLSNTITLSYNTISSGGGETTSNVITISTRVVVDGDGNNDVLVEPILANGSIEKIEVLSFGTNYSTANVTIYGSGTNATARAIFGPKYGHGINPAAELGAKHVMVASKIGVLDSTEEGKIDVDISFRQYGILSGPSKYNQVQPSIFSEADVVASQTYDVTVVGGQNYIVGERVYQGTSLSNSFFSGVVHYQNIDTNVVKLVNVTGTFTPGDFLTGQQSFTTKAAISIKNPDLQPFSGNILAARNRTKIDRALGQAEFLKIVLNFKD